MQMNMTVATVISILNSGAHKRIDPRDQDLYRETLRNFDAIGANRFSSVDQNNAAIVKAKLAQFKPEGNS
jgi:hypothetical protein